MDIRYDTGALAATGVTLKVSPGKIVGLIGESGSGKSSVALGALGLLPDTAQITVDKMEIAGRDVVGLSEREWGRIRGRSAGMVFQEPMTALNPSMRVGAQIAEALRIHHLASNHNAAQRAVELLRLVQMPDPDTRVEFYPHQLSGGQRQRVVIAIAMAADPQLLVADEPTTALDVTVQSQILHVFARLRDMTGVGILFISHDLGVIGALCDTVNVMYRGRVVETGDVSSVLAKPQHPYTQALLASLPRNSIPPRSHLETITDEKRALFAQAAEE